VSSSPSIVPLLRKTKNNHTLLHPDCHLTREDRYGSAGVCPALSESFPHNCPQGAPPWSDTPLLGGSLHPVVCSLGMKARSCCLHILHCEGPASSRVPYGIGLYELPVLSNFPSAQACFPLLPLRLSSQGNFTPHSPNSFRSLRTYLSGNPVYLPFPPPGFRLMAAVMGGREEYGAWRLKSSF
jgi:hypothetical protein